MSSDGVTWFGLVEAAARTLDLAEHAPRAQVADLLRRAELYLQAAELVRRP